MNFAAVFHRAQAPYSYAPDPDTLVLRLATGPEVERVLLCWGDPFEAGILGGAEHWQGRRQEMDAPLALEHGLWWAATLRPPYKRCRYYFELHQGGEVWLYGEDGFAAPPADGEHPACFTQPWLNPADIPAPPSWVADTVWYQIFPDRFARSAQSPVATPWRDGPVTNRQRFGGDLRGIAEKLDHIAGLGANGLYLNPIFAADSVHKYDTRDYEHVDPDFGTDADFAALVDAAHARGMRVMIDAVFNHSGANFAPWLDVRQKGPGSPYWDWFMVNRWPLDGPARDTRDGRYYSFAFTPFMPKLNTNCPAVIDYLAGLCERWVRDFHVDALRFDVGNEISHRLIKEIHRRVKAINPQVYLLGEIWHDASPWLEADEYDAVMNYPLRRAITDFFADPARSAQSLGWDLYRCLGMYRRQTVRAQFNLLDSHDTMRLITRSGSEDAFFQQLALLLCLPGSPSLYYGTEIALPGGHDPDCRRCMPWDKLGEPQNAARMATLRALVGLRRALPDLRGDDFRFVDTGPGRRVCCRRGGVEILLNAGAESWAPAPGGEVLFARGVTGPQACLDPGGICIRRRLYA